LIIIEAEHLTLFSPYRSYVNIRAIHCDAFLSHIFPYFYSFFSTSNLTPQSSAEASWGDFFPLSDSSGINRKFSDSSSNSDFGVVLQNFLEKVSEPSIDIDIDIDIDIILCSLIQVTVNSIGSSFPFCFHLNLAIRADDVIEG
jgi:hypothetical protein